MQQQGYAMAQRRFSLKAASSTFGLALLLGISSVATSARPDPWTGDGGSERARTAIARCLKSADAKLADREPCIDSALKLCLQEHGDSQHALNDCAAFSNGAWEARLAAARSRLMDARDSAPLPGRSAEVMTKLLDQSQRRWDDWNRADCDMQAALSEGGSMHPMIERLCLAEHSAHRALELESMIEDFSKVFEL